MFASFNAETSDANDEIDPARAHGVARYLNKYGFGIEIDESVERESTKRCPARETFSATTGVA
ncbi:hypothetical protein LQ564_06990 [Massilia sp. G4R7]|uniref:Uncharacterized protein n=1 Tax=Massilia phyllostachyos TaxID=2898585 RepID=A0ABS8Q2T1_9BURK|nr:hypothetical protein [Massilia phyllostachyos]MCD2516059.1 hypothetical protein [Massilia phyllostachyos]